MPRDDAFLRSLTVAPSSNAIDTSTWQCDDAIDWFLRNAAGDFHAKNLSAVTCWLTNGALAGYVATSMTTIQIDQAPQLQRLGLHGLFLQPTIKIKYFPAVLIGMLGVCRPYQGKGLAGEMVRCAIGQALELSAMVGCRFVTVDSEPTDPALALYRSSGFEAVEKQDAKRRSVWMFFDLGPRATS